MIECLEQAVARLLVIVIQNTKRGWHNGTRTEHSEKLLVLLSPALCLTHFRTPTLLRKWLMISVASLELMNA